MIEGANACLAANDRGPHILGFHEHALTARRRRAAYCGAARLLKEREDLALLGHRNNNRNLSDHWLRRARVQPRPVSASPP